MGIQKSLKIRGSVSVSRPRSSANKVQPNLFLPGWSPYNLQLTFIVILLKQKMFLGVPSVVRGKDKISSYDEYKQTKTFNF